MIVKRFLRLFRAHRDLEERLRRAEESKRHIYESLYRMADLAQHRYSALRSIQRAVTPNANATVRRMAALAVDGLKDPERHE